MEQLNLVNLIQAGMVSCSMLGGLLLWHHKALELRGVAVLLFGIALAALVNILEESGLTRGFFLISPVFIMLFGPGIYLALSLLIKKQLASKQGWHFLPLIPLLMLLPYSKLVIAIGTIWRLGYACLTVKLLLQYKRTLDEERSDADDFSLTWLVWLLVITSVFNVIDLIRLNVQQVIPYEINLLGQGINNAVWLVAVMMIILKLHDYQKIPKKSEKEILGEVQHHNRENDYHSLYAELDTLFTTHRWFLTPRLTLSDVSHFTGLQTRDISRAINLCGNKSFNDYVNRYRVDYVCNVLRQDHQQTLSDIAANAGFSSKASFNKVFKQIAGVTPSEYKSKKGIYNQEPGRLLT